MSNFKEDYPDMYEKFLEMNRAMARMQQALTALSQSKISSPGDQSNISEPPPGLPPSDDLPGFLELE